MIIIRTLRKDIANYNKEDDIVRDASPGGLGGKSPSGGSWGQAGSCGTG